MPVWAWLLVGMLALAIAARLAIPAFMSWYLKKLEDEDKL